MNFSNHLLHSVLEHKTNNIHIIKLRCKMDIWVRSEISVLELQSYYSDVDYSYQIEQYKELL
jgi:hypothetical protein